MRSSASAGRETRGRAWLAFLVGALPVIFLLSLIDVWREPASFLFFEVSATRPGNLRLFYSRDGVVTDPGWSVSLPTSNVSQLARFPLRAGHYEMIGIKPLVEAGGRVTINRPRIVTGEKLREIRSSDFMAFQQLDVLSAREGEMVISPAQGATDPVGIFRNLDEIVPRLPIAPLALLRAASGKVALGALLLALMYGLAGRLPFASDNGESRQQERGLSQWIGLLALGLVLLYLRNAHSLYVPVLYEEDGKWSAGLLERGFFDMLFDAKEGNDRYFVFGNILLMALAQVGNYLFFGLNLGNLPYFVSLVSMLFYAGLALAPVVLLRDVLRLEARLLLWLLVLLVPLGDGSFEVLGRLSNVGFAFLFLALCLLVYRRHSVAGESAMPVLATDAALLLCANTNPMCYPLIAVALGATAWRDWRGSGRSDFVRWLSGYCRDVRVRSGLALAATLVVFGTWTMLRVGGGGGESLSSRLLALPNLVEAAVARSMLYPVVFPFFRSLSDATSIAILLVGAAVLLFLVFRTKAERALLIHAGLVLVAATAITLLTRPVLVQMLAHYTRPFADRYYYGLSLIVMVMIGSALSAGFREGNGTFRCVLANAISGALVGLYVGNAAHIFEFKTPRGLDLPTVTFRERVVEGYLRGGFGPSGTKYNIELHPSISVAAFPKNYVLATILGTSRLPLNIKGIGDAPVEPVADVARRYEGRVIRQKSGGRGREDGYFYVADGQKSWIPDGAWLERRKLSMVDVLEISAAEFNAIPDSGMPAK